MDGLLYWILDHPLPVLIVGVLLFAWSVARAARSLWRNARKVRTEPRAWRGVAGAVVLLLIGGAGLLYFGAGTVAMGPGLIEQARLRDKAAPALSYVHVADGAPGDLGNHRGKVVLVNLWATWCPPCRAEMPDLDRLQETYRDQGLVVLQISDEERETIASYLEEEPMSTEHGYVDRFTWPCPGRPTTYVVDREGVIRKGFSGGRDFEAFEKVVTKYL